LLRKQRKLKGATFLPHPVYQLIIMLTPGYISHSVNVCEVKINAQTGIMREKFLARTLNC